jgi:hypothetical protein
MESDMLFHHLALRPWMLVAWAFRLAQKSFAKKTYSEPQKANPEMGVQGMQQARSTQAV